MYFICTRQLTELKWGTPKAIVFRDPDFGPVRLRAFGTYTLRATNPEALIAELVGTDAVFDAEEIALLIRSMIATEFAEVIGHSGLSVLDLASHYKQLSESLRAAVAERMDQAYGLALPQLFIVNISLPEEVEQAIDAKTGMGIVGDLSEYQRYQIGHATPTLAENPAGGLAAAGVGVGMGFSLSQAYTPQGATPPAATPPTDSDSDTDTDTGAPEPAAAPPPPPAAATWYAVEDGQRVGPWSYETIADAARDGRVTPETLVWTERLTDWAPASEVEELRALFDEEPPVVE